MWVSQSSTTTRLQHHQNNNSNECLRSTRRGTVLPLQYDGKMTPPPSVPLRTSHSHCPDDVSITDEFGTNQVIVSRDDADDDPTESSELIDSSSQLIMPSIRMPSRRPFTEKGKRISQFKVLVAGANGKCLLRCDGIIELGGGCRGPRSGDPKYGARQ
jgi:hypothetical protein